ncbi:MAG: periplasmic heavy metal sensor [Bacteroidales bacterium]|nr:periplasmic heavy metal sensor [Bacteroidales bacterium]
MNNKFYSLTKLMPLIALIITGTTVLAQPRFSTRADSLFHPGMRWNAYRGLDLSEDQEKQIETLRSEHQKEMTDLRNDLAIKRAELQKLRSSENPDLNQINKKLDEIGQLTTEMSKKAIAHEQQVLNVLTDEQKSFYRAGQGRSPYLYGQRGMHFGFDRRDRGFYRSPALPFREMRRGRGF